MWLNSYVKDLRTLWQGHSLFIVCVVLSISWSLLLPCQVWYFRRLSVPTHMPGFVLTAKYVNQSMAVISVFYCSITLLLLLFQPIDSFRMRVYQSCFNMAWFQPVTQFVLGTCFEINSVDEHKYLTVSVMYSTSFRLLSANALGRAWGFSMCRVKLGLGGDNGGCSEKDGGRGVTISGPKVLLTWHVQITLLATLTCTRCWQPYNSCHKTSVRRPASISTSYFDHSFVSETQHLCRTRLLSDHVKIGIINGIKFVFQIVRFSMFCNIWLICRNHIQDC